MPVNFSIESLVVDTSPSQTSASLRCEVLHNQGDGSPGPVVRPSSQAMLVQILYAVHAVRTMRALRHGALALTRHLPLSMRLTCILRVGVSLGMNTC